MSAGIVDQLRTQAAARRATVVFAEGDDPRVVEAAAMLAHGAIVQPILIGSTTSVQSVARAARVELPKAARIIDPSDLGLRTKLLTTFLQHPAFASMSEAEALDRLRDPIVLSALLVRCGEADGCVAGAVRPTREVIQIAIRIIGLAAGVRVVSSAFLMVLADGRALTFADCAVVPEPDADQLADIAVMSARTHQQLTGQLPVVAMLSFSTYGSAEHTAVTKVREATGLARLKAPDLIIDGEMQFDAAWVEEIGKRKAPGSPVPGRANVFIFPNLDAGNIAYKITERLAHAEAIGPLLQGLSQPIHDLSRGCKAGDIVNVAAACALQAKRRPCEPSPLRANST